MKSLHTKSWLLMLLLTVNNYSCRNNDTPKEVPKEEPKTETKMVTFASGLNNPVSIANAGDSRLFIVDQEGYIRIVKADGTLNPEPFLDIHDRVNFGGERGLLGLAFHPNYQSNGYFYVNYIGEGDLTHISRFKVSSASADKADAGSEFSVLTQQQPFENHNGGSVVFGPDGFLYLGLGDGGSEGDPGNRAQDPKELLGKILRIDVNQGSPYAIPASNPFYNSSTTKGEIWALGLRNPWRFSFDRLTGDLWIADVGQDAIEEIDFQPAGDKGGQNYGWRCYEGNKVYNDSECDSKTSFTSPIYTYPHGDECSVTGGYVYRGTTSSPYYGYYFFADYCSDRIWTLHKVGGSWVKEDFGHYTGNSFTTFGEDAQGQLYIAGAKSKKIFKVLNYTTATTSGQALGEIKIP
ncbi:MAG TPA: PQQ-dependent sugar dehydrogenase [Prolixibacteraceae bacterium]|jgi:glucose/arabinose dehydrogenase